MADKNNYEAEYNTPSSKNSTILKNSVAILIIRIINDAIRFYASLRLAQYIGDTGFGHLNYILVFIEPFRIAANWGSDIAATRSMNANLELEHSYLHKLLQIKRFTSAISLFFMFIVMFMFVDSVYWLGLALMGATLPLFCLSFSWRVIPQNHHQMHLFIPFQVLEGFIYVGLVFFGIYLQVSISYFYIIYVVNDLLYYFISRYVLKVKLKFKFEKIKNIPWKDIIIPAMPIAIADIIVVVYTRLSTVLLETNSTDAAYGQYLMAVRTSEFILFIASALATSLLPTLSHLIDKKPTEAKKLFGRYYFLGMAIVFPVMVILGQVSYLYFGFIRDEFLNSVAPFQVCAITSACMFQNILSACFINAFGKHKYVLYLTFINLSVNIICCLTLIPAYHGMGAAYSQLITEGFNMLMQVCIVFWIFSKLNDKNQVNDFS